ncbi:MAG TPA: MBL fold metallo-hydrolase [Synergistaceae bacterium]|nr:MBL fold metallo-hydrolase [Synergistaceae bacterium]HPQ37076.1 MBL fold metallo-hydrolase [Synergistaceae bacterium]
MNIRRFPLGSLWTNGYLFWDAEGKAFFVDPGGDPREVLDFMQKEQIILERILLTHGHADHMCGVESMRGETKAPVAVHEEDAFMLEHPEHNLSQFLGAPCSAGPAEVLLSEGDSFHVGNMRIRVIHTPGHTPGSCLFYVTENEETALLSGDTLFAQSVGRTDLPGGNNVALEHSLRRFAEFSENLRVLPGHGPETTIGEEKHHNPYWPR